MWIICIPITFIILFFVYNFVIVPKMNNSYDKKLNKLIDEFANEVNGQEDEYRRKFVSTNKTIDAFATIIDDYNILGAISCQQKIELKDVVRQEAVNAARKVAGKMIGVDLEKQKDNEEYYFLVLTLTTLNYVHYDDSGKCVEFLIFERSQMRDIESGEVTSADMLKNKAFLGDSNRLSFTYGDSKFKFFYYKDLFPFPTDKNRKDQDIAKLKYLFAKPFIEFAENYKSVKA